MSTVTSPTRPNIAIIGGGPSGLVLLLTLYRRGVSATLYERDKEFNARAHLGGTLDLGWESGQRALRENGLQELLDQNSRPEGDEYKFCDASANVLHHQPSDPNKHSTEVRPEIDRSVLRKLLLDACPADAIKWGHTLVSIRPLDSGLHELTFDNGTTTVCDVLVGADGANSRIRPLVSPATPAYTGVNGVEISLTPEDVVRPDMADVRELVGQGTALGTEKSKFLFSQMNSSGRIRTYAWFRGPEDWMLPREPAEARKVLLDLYAGWHPTWLKLIERCDGEAIYPRSLYYLPTDHRWEHVPGVTLIGDAANLMSPFSGAGANVAMLAGLELGIALAGAISGGKTVTEREAAVRAYEESMFVKAGRMAALSKENLDAFIHPEAPAYAIEKMKNFFSQPTTIRDESNKGAVSPN